jgi:hypothetical protein
MSYLPKADREAIDSSPIGNCELSDSNEFSYAILQLAIQFIGNDSARADEAVGAIESAKVELYRVLISPSTMQRKFDFE